jgi:hypothetical protein
MDLNTKSQFNFLSGLSPAVADGFYKVGYGLARKIHNDTSIFGFIGLAPAVVNFTLSAELYLKAIYMVQFKRRITGHLLIKLYDGLPSMIKRSIEKDYQNNRQNLKKEVTSYRITFGPSNMNDDSSKDSKTYDTIEKLLSNHQDAFEKWRYLYELGNQKSIQYEYDFFSMNCFIRAVQNYLNAILTESISQQISGKKKI